MEILRTEKLIKSFIDGGKEVNILKAIDLSVKQGEFIAITGKSGSGKSTLIYQIGLLDSPTNGDVFVGGISSTKSSEPEKTKFRLDNFGFVFQDYALIPDLTAIENIILPMIMRGESIEQAKVKALEVMDSMGIKNKAENLPNEMSGGENQRVSIARAIAHKPKVLFADEPTANLDSEKSRQIIDIFHKLNKEGQTIIMVTHEEVYAKEADRVIVLKDGKIEKEEIINKK